MAGVFLTLTHRFRKLLRRKWAAKNFRRVLIFTTTNLPLGPESEGEDNGSSESELEMQTPLFCHLEKERVIRMQIICRLSIASWPAAFPLNVYLQNIKSLSETSTDQRVGKDLTVQYLCVFEVFFLWDWLRWWGLLLCGPACICSPVIYVLTPKALFSCLWATS